MVRYYLALFAIIAIVACMILMKVCNEPSHVTIDGLKIGYNEVLREPVVRGMNPPQRTTLKHDDQTYQGQVSVQCWAGVSKEFQPQNGSPGFWILPDGRCLWASPLCPNCPKCENSTTTTEAKYYNEIWSVH